MILSLLHSEYENIYMYRAHSTPHFLSKAPGKIHPRSGVRVKKREKDEPHVGSYLASCNVAVLRGIVTALKTHRQLFQRARRSSIYISPDESSHIANDEA